MGMLSGTVQTRCCQGGCWIALEAQRLLEESFALVARSWLNALLRQIVTQSNHPLIVARDTKPCILLPSCPRRACHLGLARASHPQHFATEGPSGTVVSPHLLVRCGRSRHSPTSISICDQSRLAGLFATSFSYYSENSTTKAVRGRGTRTGCLGCWRGCKKCRTCRKSWPYMAASRDALASSSNLTWCRTNWRGAWWVAWPRHHAATASSDSWQLHEMLPRLARFPRGLTSPSSSFLFPSFTCVPTGDWPRKARAGMTNRYRHEGTIRAKVSLIMVYAGGFLIASAIGYAFG